MRIKIKKIADEIRMKDPDLITRPVGRQFFKKTCDKLKNIAENEVVIIDFEGYKVIDSSFVDEFLVKIILLSRDKEKPFYVKIMNNSDIAEINIDLVFKSYTHYKQEKIVVMTEDICHNNRFFIGSLNEIEKDIIQYLRINKSASVHEIAKFTGKEPEEISPMMKELHELRAVRFDRGDMYITV